MSDLRGGTNRQEDSWRICFRRFLESKHFAGDFKPAELVTLALHVVHSLVDFAKDLAQLLYLAYNCVIARTLSAEYIADIESEYWLQ